MSSPIGALVLSIATRHIERIAVVIVAYHPSLERFARLHEEESINSKAKCIHYSESACKIRPKSTDDAWPRHRPLS